MRHISLATALLCAAVFVSCVNNEIKTPENKLIDTALKSRKLEIKYATKAILKHSEKNYGDDQFDTLISVIDNNTFLILPQGKVFLGAALKDSIQLKSEAWIEEVFLYKIDSSLLIFYTESDGGDGSIQIEKINLKSRKSLWQNEIVSVNLGLPYIVDKFAYLTANGFIGKLDLENGKFTYKYDALYDNKKNSFNSFDTIIFKDTLIMFLSKNISGKGIDSVIVNEKTNSKIIHK